MIHIPFACCNVNVNVVTIIFSFSVLVFVVVIIVIVSGKWSLSDSRQIGNGFQ